MEEEIEPVDAPNEKPDEDDEEVNGETEPNGVLLGCQLECPNKLELVLLLELMELAAEEEAEVPSPKVGLELKILVAGLEANNELPDEKVAFTDDPNGDDVDEPNWIDWL